jgi:hypothetical protein
LPVRRIADSGRESIRTSAKADYHLILCRIFHLARRFLLPILRLRLGFAIYFSRNNSKILYCKTFNPL